MANDTATDGRQRDAHGDGAPHAVATPFFIVGSGRSGTTLVRSILDAHSAIAVPPETHFLKRVRHHGAPGRAAPRDFDAFWRDLVDWSRFRDLDIAPEHVRRLIDEAGDRDFRTIFLAMLTAYAARAGKRRIGEKTPSHYRHLDTIFAWFPDARVVVLRRDPRDVVASHMSAPWVTAERRARGLGAPLVRRLRLFHVAERALFWRQAHGDFLAGAEADPRMHVVFYEALATRPETVVPPLCAFLGEPFEPAMLSPRDARAPAGPGTVRSDWRAKHNARAGAPVSAGSIGRWRERLSPLEAEIVEAVCGETMRRHGYAPETDGAAGRRLAPLVLAAGRTEDRLRAMLRRR